MDEYHQIVGRKITLPEALRIIRYQHFKPCLEFAYSREDNSVYTYRQCRKIVSKILTQEKLDENCTISLSIRLFLQSIVQTENSHKGRNTYSYQNKPCIYTEDVNNIENAESFIFGTYITTIGKSSMLFPEKYPVVISQEYGKLQAVLKYCNIPFDKYQMYIYHIPTKYVEKQQQEPDSHEYPEDPDFVDCPF